MKKIILLLSITFAFISQAGDIRTEYVSEKKMGLIKLNLGRSTVLNFDSPPKKVICGNANFFNIEFTGNDVTIQPLGQLVSNLFIYTDKYRYGFVIMPTKEGASYDDLVYVKWWEPKTVKTIERIQSVRVRSDKNFQIELTDVKKLEGNNVHIIDSMITNLSDTPLRIDHDNFWATRSNKVIPIIEKVYTKDELSIGESAKVRFIMRLRRKKGFTTHFKFNDKKLSFIVKGKNL